MMWYDVMQCNVMYCTIYFDVEHFLFFRNRQLYKHDVSGSDAQWLTCSARFSRQPNFFNKAWIKVSVLVVFQFVSCGRKVIWNAFLVPIHTCTSMYLCIDIHICISIYISVSIYLHVPIFLYIYISVDLYICTCTYIYIYILSCLLRYNQLSTIPHTLGSCTYLDEFNIEGNHVTELPVSNRS